MSARFDRELKKGSAELLVLSLVEHRARHGYEIGKLIDERSQGQIRFKAASLYPLLYRLEHRGWIQGRWVERAGERRRRYYTLDRTRPQGAGGASIDLGRVRQRHSADHGAGARLRPPSARGRRRKGNAP